MTVSVILPVYNEESRLGNCLAGLIDQVAGPHEIIVVDNNSSDRSAEIARMYGVRLISEPVQGITAARNAGFNAATNDILVKLDADVTIPPGWFAELERAFKRGGKKMVALGGPLVSPDLPRYFGGQSRWWWIANQALMRAIYWHPTLVGSQYALTRQAWLAVRDDVCLDDHKVHEDQDIAAHLNRIGTIVYDRNFWVYASGRRILTNPYSWFVEYTIRTFRTRLRHKK